MIEQTTGRWICELAELAGLRKREVEEVKAFLSRQDDEARLAYGRTTERRPRQFITIATINPNATGQYLHDATGNRRFWPVKVKRCDVASLRRDRNQLWAEAAAIEATGEALYLEASLGDEARAVQAERLVSDPWRDAIERFIACRTGMVAAYTLWDVLQIDKSRQDTTTSARVAQIMQTLGFQKTQRKQAGVNVRGFTNCTVKEGTKWLR